MHDFRLLVEFFIQMVDHYHGSSLFRQAFNVLIVHSLKCRNYHDFLLATFVVKILYLPFEVDQFILSWRMYLLLLIRDEMALFQLEYEEVLAENVIDVLQLAYCGVIGAHRNMSELISSQLMLPFVQKRRPFPWYLAQFLSLGQRLLSCFQPVDVRLLLFWVHINVFAFSATMISLFFIIFLLKFGLIIFKSKCLRIVVKRSQILLLVFFPIALFDPYFLWIFAILFAVLKRHDVFGNLIV